MANAEHLALLKRDVDEWNEWRLNEPAVVPDLAHADLSGLNLVLVNFSGALLREADLSLANLMGADLRNADLRGANLVGARPIGVDLAGADLRGTDVRTAEDLTAEQLEETVGDERTQLPDDLPRPARWSSLLDAR